MLPNDVDYRVMLTFLEFYQTMLRFVHFRLYHMLGATYPPRCAPRPLSHTEHGPVAHLALFPATW